eukprot:gene3527-13593_t
MEPTGWEASATGVLVLALDPYKGSAVRRKLSACHLTATTIRRLRLDRGSAKKRFAPPLVQVKQLLESIGAGRDLRVVQCTSTLQGRKLQRVVKEQRPVQLSRGRQAEVHLGVDSNNVEVAMKSFKWIRVRTMKALGLWVPENRVSCL